ncbi:MAG: ADP-ribosylglycohydrolase family protein, partial [Pseudomonadota bacterium]
MSGDAAGAIWGGFVADAASLGFHWLYDPKRIAELAGDAPAFRAPDPADFDGAMGVFVHPGKRAGDLSQYGVQMRVMLDSLRAVGGWDKGDFQTRFAQTFGAGGSWSGYIDKATKGTLAGIAEEREPSGAADDQLPAIAKLPPLMWALRWNDGWAAAAMEAVEVTSNHDTVRAWAPAAIAAL